MIDVVLASLAISVFWVVVASLLREAFNKKTVKFGNCSQIAVDPPTLAYLGILNCYFFIGYLGLLNHEVDLEINLFFSFTIMAYNLEIFHTLPNMF